MKFTPNTVLVDAVLFDLDGTLIDSTPGVLKAWDAFAKQYSFDASQAARATHGRRLYDTLKDWCRISDENTLRSEVQRFEEAVVNGGLAVLPGAQQLLNKLAACHDAGWTIVTSSTTTYARGAFERCGIPFPAVGIVTSDDVQRGKPHPDPYLAGARKCNVNPVNCLVIEDAPSGLLAGRSAGAKTLAVCTSHSRRDIQDSGANPDFIVSDLTKVDIQLVDGKVAVMIDIVEDCP